MLTVCRRKSLILIGGSQLGKTVWARSLGPHIFFSGLYSAAEAVRAPDVEYAIMDDIQGGMGFFHGYKNWLGAQWSFQVKRLYKDPALITWGKPCIWCCNWVEDPRGVAGVDQEWLRDNCLFVELHTAIAGPISHANTE